MAVIMDIQHLRADYLINKYIASPSFPHIGSGLLQIIVTFFLATFSITIFLLIIRKVLSIKNALTEPSVLLELTPPAFTEKTSYTTQQLFTTLHDLSRQTALSNRIIGRKRIFSFEVVSTKTQGIRYIIRTEKKYKNSLKHHILSYLPQVRVNEVEDYLPESRSVSAKIKIIELELTKHFAYPLRIQNNLEEHDPVAYITGVMTKLQPDELISMQMALTPSSIPDKERIKNMIYRGEDVLSFLDTFRLPTVFQFILFPINIFVKITIAILSVFAGATKMVVNDFVDPRMSARQAQLQYQTQYAMQAVKSNIRPARVITPFEQQAIESIENKIEQKMFQTQVRLLMVMNNAENIAEREHSFLSALSMFTSANDQGLKKKLFVNLPIFNEYFYFLYRKRLLSFISNSSQTLLSVSELSDMYHFPFSNVTQTENIVKAHSKELPSPLSLKKAYNLDTVFAKNTYAGTSTMIGLTADERRRHMYVIGATGTGKSTLLLSMIAQDIKNGKGVAVVDPHGELAETVLCCIPKNRIKDVIYFNPDDLKYPIRLNLLELTPNLDEEDMLREKEFIAESIVSLFRKVFSDSMVGNPHRIEYILRNTIHTAFTVEDSTLFTIFDLLNDPKYQKKIVGSLKDENLKNFWKHEFGKAGDFQKVKMISPITSRIGRFLFSPSAKRILEQSKSTINFDNIMNSGKILVCNLSKGKLGEDTSQVLGIMILNKIQLASLKRSRVKSSERRDFYLYVDEFQNFATKSFIDILSESRKYKLNLTMAEQSTSQLRDKHLVHTILANAGTIISFKTANPEDEKLLLPQFTPYIEQGEIANLPAFHFYMKISAINPEEPFSGETMLLDNQGTSHNIDLIIQESRKNFASVYEPKQSKDIEDKVNKQADKMKVSSGLPA